MKGRHSHKKASRARTRLTSLPKRQLMPKRQQQAEFLSYRQAAWHGKARHGTARPGSTPSPQAGQRVAGREDAHRGLSARPARAEGKHRAGLSALPRARAGKSNIPLPVPLFHRPVPPRLLPEQEGNSHGETWQQARLILENGLLGSPRTPKATQEHADPVETRTSRAPCTACSKANHAADIKNLRSYRSSRKNREDAPLAQALWGGAARSDGFLQRPVGEANADTPTLNSISPRSESAGMFKGDEPNTS